MTPILSRSGVSTIAGAVHTSAGPTLAYNAKDQMTGYTAPGLLGTTTPMEYLDTGQFERIQAGGTTFSTGPLGLASSTDAAVLSTNYVRDSNGGLVARKDLLGTQYYLFDRLGSVVALTDSAGNAVNTYVYDPYGNHLSGTTEAVANPWQFAGGFKDSFSGYYKFGTRYYDPIIGRWTQPDPSGFEANSYAYAAGNPVNFVDPDGEFAFAIPAGMAAYKGFMWAAGAATALIAAGAAGEATGQYWAKRDNVDRPAYHGVNHPTKKKAREAAQHEGGSEPIHHPNSRDGQPPHYHPTDRTGKKISGTHHNYPK